MTVLFLQLGNSSRWLASARCMMHDMNHTVVTIMMWRFLHKDGHPVDSLNLQWPSSYSFDLTDRLTCSPCRCALSKFISWHRHQQLPAPRRNPPGTTCVPSAWSEKSRQVHILSIASCLSYFVLSFSFFWYRYYAHPQTTIALPRSNRCLRSMQVGWRTKPSCCWTFVLKRRKSVTSISRASPRLAGATFTLTSPVLIRNSATTS